MKMNNKYNIKKLNESLYWIWEFYHDEKVISYLIIWKDKCLLIDSGMWIYNIKELISEITNLPVYVFNTHYHFDHIWWNYLFDNIISIKDEYRDLVSKKWFSNIQLREYYSEESFNNIDGFVFSNYNIKPFEISDYISIDDFINIEPFCFKLIYTPGHTNDSYCLFEINNWWLFTWDTLYEWPIYVSNIFDYITSIEKISKLSISQIYPWHNSFLFWNELLELIKKWIDNLDTKLFSWNDWYKINITDKISFINYEVNA